MLLLLKFPLVESECIFNFLLHPYKFGYSNNEINTGMTLKSYKLLDPQCDLRDYLVLTQKNAKIKKKNIE